MQSQASTAQIKEQLLTSAQKVSPIAEQQSYYQRFLLRAHFGYNLSNTFIKTGFASALLITDTFGGDAVFGCMSSPGIALGVTLGLYFGLCEGHAHNAESKHFNRANNNKNATYTIENQPAPHPEIEHPSRKNPSIKQYLLAGGHFLSDVMGGVEPLMFFAQKALGFDQISPLSRGLSYLGMGIYSLIGNLQEWNNTTTAFKEDNTEEQHIHKAYDMV